jgi:disulfide bond formation protein DsbB
LIAALLAQFEKRPAGAVALAILLGAGASIAGAWTFEAWGYIPCELCLLGRKPYYVGIGVAALCVALSARGRDDLARKGQPLLALIFLVGAAIAAYHAGVEWKLWPGPADCTGPMTAPASQSDFLSRLKLVKPIRCDEPALLVFGFSLAAWSALLCAAFSGLAAWSFWRGRRPR